MRQHNSGTMYISFENIIAWAIPSKAASASSAQTYTGDLLFMQWYIMSWVSAAAIDVPLLPTKTKSKIMKFVFPTFCKDMNF